MTTPSSYGLASKVKDSIEIMKKRQLQNERSVISFEKSNTHDFTRSTVLAAKVNDSIELAKRNFEKIKSSRKVRMNLSRFG